MGLDRLEYFRRIVLNGNELESNLVKGEISIETEQGKMSSCSFQMYNESNVVPIVSNPIGSARSMIGQRIEIYAGYKRGFDTEKRLFRGIVKRSGMRFERTGRVIVTVEGYSYGYSLANTKRSEVYPVIAREKDPTVDSQGSRARAERKGDDRPWAVLKTGQTISLEKVITEIVGQYDVEIGQILVPDITYDGINRELHQNKESDWKFLNRLASRFGCHMTIDEVNGKFYFIQKEAVQNEEIITENGQRVSHGLEFYFHRLDIDESDPWVMAPKERLDPTLQNAALPMLDVSYQFDATRVLGGMVTQSTDADGNVVLTSTVVDADNKVSYEKLVLRKELLATAEADRFIRDFKIGETTWEDTKQFWKTENVEVQHAPDSRNNPPVTMEANLNFSTFGSPHVVPMRRYPVYNLGFGEQQEGFDKTNLLCVGISHKLGDTWKMGIAMWAF